MQCVPPTTRPRTTPRTPVDETNFGSNKLGSMTILVSINSLVSAVAANALKINHAPYIFPALAFDNKAIRQLAHSILSDHEDPQMQLAQLKEAMDYVWGDIYIYTRN